MLMNLRNAMMTGKRLPYLCELEYLESTGTQWIDTGIKSTADSSAEIAFQLVSAAETKAIFGTVAQSSAVSPGFFLGTASNRLVYANDTGTAITPNVSMTTGIDYVAAIVGTTVTINGSVFSAAAVAPSDYNIFLLARNRVGVAERAITGRIYYAKLYSNNALVRDFIPVLGYDYEACMYDRVTRQFFRNAGTGEFVAGPRKGWVNPYVTDGLVAMWDGEWNFTGGVHDPSATMWRDLVGTAKWALSNNHATYSWNDNALLVSQETTAGSYIICTTLDSALMSALNTATGFTVEIVAQKLDSFTTSADQWISSASSNPFLIQSYLSNNNIYLYINNNSKYIRKTSFDVRNVFSASLVDVKADGFSAYINGSYYDTLSDAAYTPNFTEVRLYNRGGAKARYNIRLYSRALTASEIAANYAVDKARFGLP